MTPSPGGTAEEFVTLARVIKTQGRNGEVAVEVHSDVSDRLHAGLRVFALDERDNRRELQIGDAWPHKDWLVLKFAGIDSISDAVFCLKKKKKVEVSEGAEREAGEAFV